MCQAEDIKVREDYTEIQSNFSSRDMRLTIDHTNILASSALDTLPAMVLFPKVKAKYLGAIYSKVTQSILNFSKTV